MNWQYDDEPYFVIRNDKDKYDLRPSNTILYLFDEVHEDADHIFRMVGESSENIMGLRIWRSLVDKVLGDGSFDDLCEEMVEHNFDVDESTAPSPLDIKAWEQYAGLSYASRPVIESIVSQSMDSFDSEWKYYATD